MSGDSFTYLGVSSALLVLGGALSHYKLQHETCMLTYISEKKELLRQQLCQNHWYLTSLHYGFVACSSKMQEKLLYVCFFFMLTNKKHM